jgi:hypothetical protein
MDHLAAALALVRGAACYTLTPGTPGETAHIIRDVLERSA